MTFGSQIDAVFFPFNDTGSVVLAIHINGLP